MASVVLSFFSLDVLDGILDLTESFSEGFLTYSSTYFLQMPVSLALCFFLRAQS